MDEDINRTDTKDSRPQPPVKLAKRDGQVYSEMLNRVFPDAGVSQLDVCAFQSSI